MVIPNPYDLLNSLLTELLPILIGVPVVLAVFSWSMNKIGGLEEPSKPAPPKAEEKKPADDYGFFRAWWDIVSPYLENSFMSAAEFLSKLFGIGYIKKDK